MSRTIFYLLALSVTLATVASLKFRYDLPTVASSLHRQCVAKGYYGECWNFNRIGGWPHCKRTYCAVPTRGHSYRAHKVRAHAPNGLKCGPNKMCYEGKCIVPGVAIPVQSFLSNVRIPMKCFQ